MQAYAKLDFTPEELSTAMREGYEKLISFVTTPQFKALHQEMKSLPPEKRPSFVANVVLQPAELAKRDIFIPEGILVQTSAFGDRRPTLFAVKVFLPLRFHKAWENVNLTFDNEYEDASVSRNPEKTWRIPLPVTLHQMISQGADLESAASP